jgi:hypothetical protein
MPTRIRFGLLTAVLSLLAACGGGSNNNTPPPGGNQPPPAPVPAPTAEDNANARSSQLKLSLRADTRELTITWTDTFSAETGYTVEAQSAGGAWQTLESLPAGQATGTPYEWKRVIDAPRTFRITATRSGYSVPLVTEGGQTEILVNLASTPMTIEVDQTPPVRGTVQLSLANALDVHTVYYYVDFTRVGISTTAPQFPVSWNAGDMTDGDHLIVAVVSQSSGAAIEVRRPIVVDNPNVAISLRVAPTPDNPDEVSMSGQVTANAGVRQIEFFANGAAVHVMTNPPQSYVHRISKAGLPSGTNVFRVVATDATGATAEATAQLLIDDPPVLTVTSPTDGAIVTNSVRIAGTLTEDTSSVTMTISLGDLPIHTTSSVGAFGFDYSIAGLAPGEYNLFFRVRDGKGQQAYNVLRIIVPPSQFTYERVASGVAKLLASEQGALVYKKTDGSVVLRGAGGVETTLQIPSTFRFINDWQMSRGRVVMAASDETSRHIYTFAADGQVINLSQPTGSISNNNNHAVLKGSRVVWYGNDYYQIYNLDTDEVTVVARPAAATELGRAAYDLVTTPGSEQLLFWGRTGGTDMNPIYDLFRYSLNTGTTDRLTGGDGQHRYVETDNTRLVWTKGSGTEADLLAAPVANPSATTVLSPTVWEFELRDGLVAWVDDNGFDLIQNIMVNDGTTTTVLASATPGAYVGHVSDGRVTFGENQKFMLWSASGGKQMLLNNRPTDPGFHDDGIAFIGTGASDSMSVHRVVLP